MYLMQTVSTGPTSRNVPCDARQLDSRYTKMNSRGGGNVVNANHEIEFFKSPTSLHENAYYTKSNPHNDVSYMSNLNSTAVKENGNSEVGFQPGISVKQNYNADYYSPRSNSYNTNEFRSPQPGHRQLNTASTISSSEEKKRDKKWSLGGFFRRRKKEVESDSSSQEDFDQKKGFMSRRRGKKKQERKKKPVFDHIVFPRDENGFKYPSGDNMISEQCTNSTTKKNENGFNNSESNSWNVTNTNRESSVGSGSLDNVSKRGHRLKARAEAIRDRIGDESSSDEGSQRSSSSVVKFKSDENISRSRDSSLNRKSRSARTERYNKRFSRAEDTPESFNNDSRLKPPKTGTQKSPSVSPVLKDRVRSDNSIANVTYTGVSSNLNYPGVSTIPPSHNVTNKKDLQRVQHYQNAIPYLQLQRTVPNEYYMPTKRSLSFENNINYSSNGQGSGVHRNQSLNQIYPVSCSPRSPPPPPPRDPQRKIINSFENISQRPMSYAFDNRNKRLSSSTVQSQQNSIQSALTDWNRPYVSYKSNSDDHIAQTQFVTAQVHPRPSSVTPESTEKQKRFITRHGNELAKYQYFAEKIPRSRKPIHIATSDQTERMPHNQIRQTHSDQYINGAQYRAKEINNGNRVWKMKDQPNLFLNQQQYYNNSFNAVSMDQQTQTDKDIENMSVQSATEFWRQKEQESMKRRQEEEKIKKHERKDCLPSPVLKRNTNMLFEGSKSDIEKKSIDRNSLKQNTYENSNKKTSEHIYNNVDSKPMMISLKKCTPVIENRSTSFKDDGDRKYISKLEVPLKLSNPEKRADNNKQNTVHDKHSDENDSDTKRRKSTNLEEALNELEAIYNSLHLGDEDLLDRAELRDVTTPKHQREPYFNWGIPRGALSDSGYNYGRDSSSVESLVEGDQPIRRSRLSRRSGVPDRVKDDMAYRRLNQHDRKSSQESIPQVSYLLASPVLSDHALDDKDGVPSQINSKEPDILLDDVVYRNIKHTKNALKILDPQPPFGIPIGPITPAPNSDYLHATPENRPRSRFIPHKSPDIVKDDLAFRSLRKDECKEAALPPLVPEDSNVEIGKKKRAVRSLSANLHSLVQRDCTKSPNFDENEFGKTQSLSDINDSIEMAKRIIRERIANQSNSPTSTETLTNSSHGLDKSVHQRLRVHVPDNCLSQKPPLPGTPTENKSSRPPTKSSTPVCISPEPDIKDKEDDLLSVLAKEANETNEQLGQELKEMDENMSSKNIETCRIVDETPKLVKIKHKNIEDSLKEIDTVSEHAKLCEKLLECVVESTELIAPKVAETVELQPVIDTELEEIENINELPESIANVVMTRKPDVPTELLLDTVESDRLSAEIICSKPEQVYDEELECLKLLKLSDSGKERDDTDGSKSPFEIHKVAILQDFAELKKNLLCNDEDKETKIKNHLLQRLHEGSVVSQYDNIPALFSANSKEETMNDGVDFSDLENVEVVDVPEGFMDDFYSTKTHSSKSSSTTPVPSPDFGPRSIPKFPDVSDTEDCCNSPNSIQNKGSTNAEG